ncbi:MAG: hypothetical protein ACJ74O_04105 [Frankiaceae bacterium]
MLRSRWAWAALLGEAAIVAWALPRAIELVGRAVASTRDRHWESLLPEQGGWKRAAAARQPVAPQPRRAPTAWGLQLDQAGDAISYRTGHEGE